MKFSILLFVSALLAMHSGAQVSLKAVASQQPTVLGESFQVQYIFEESEKFSNFSPPDFKPFRVVAGPDEYTGSVNANNHIKQVRNLVFTLTAPYIGVYIIPGGTAKVNNQSVRSNNVRVEVVTAEEAAKRFQRNESVGNSEYFLRPGEDPYEKIDKNLFLKVRVDHQSCFVGEPVEATFKLYSRLESKSDIIKNPGFYGFTVYDMVNLSNKLVTTETVKGKLFDVHTIRRVQLYPLQAGIYTIDPMEVKNRVEFSRSTVNKKTEQEIIEGVLGIPEEAHKENTEVFETDISTPFFSINVKPVPLKNKPDSYAGALGNFRISAQIIKEPLSKDKEGILEVVIIGKGNFIQLSPPPIQWPPGIEGFEPEINDSFDKTRTPLSGSRTFRYRFIPAREGVFAIPPIDFAYFNPDSGSYKIAKTDLLAVRIADPEKKMAATPKKTRLYGNGAGIKVWLAVILAVILAIGLLWIIRKRKKIIKEEPPLDVSKNRLTIEEVMVPVYLCEVNDDPGFYHSLQQSIWKYVNHHFGLYGSESKKDILIEKLRVKSVSEDLISELFNVLQECEEGIFAHVGNSLDKNSLLLRAKDVLEKIDLYLL